MKLHDSGVEKGKKVSNTLTNLRLLNPLLSISKDVFADLRVFFEMTFSTL